MKRTPISKKTRFSVFSRDSFTCRYCGQQSDVVPLVVDHIMPVCQGGSNEPENLATCCVDCNQGKGGRTIDQSAANETDRLRIFQETHEQRAAALAAKIATDARLSIRKRIAKYFSEATGRSNADKQTISTLVAYVREFGPDLVLEWIDKATYRLAGKPDRQIGCYISGIRRSYIRETLGGVAPTHNYVQTLR